MTVKLLRLIGVVAILLTAASGLRAAETQEPSRFLKSRWGFTVGGYAADLSTDAQFSFGNGLGTLFRLEDVTDYDAAESVLRADGFVRFGKRHAMEFQIIQINRNSSGSLSEDLEILDRLFVAGFESAFDMSLYKASYKFSFQNDGKLDAGLLIGLSVFDFGFEMEGDIEISDPNGMVTFSTARETTDVLAPVPSAGMFMEYAFTPRFGTRARAEWLNIEVGDYEGQFIEFRWTLDYLFSNVFGIGGGVSSTDMSFAKLGNDPAKVDYQYNGILFYLNFLFGEMP